MTMFATVAVAGKPEYSTLVYDNGKRFKTNFYDARLLGELSVPNSGPILVFSGKPSGPCDLPYCDPETSVYFQPTSQEPSISGRTLSYPGYYYASESGKLVARVRMFIGRCIDEREGVAWFVENYEQPRQEYATLMRTHVAFEFVDRPHMDGQIGALLATGAQTKYICPQPSRMWIYPSRERL